MTDRIRMDNEPKNKPLRVLHLEDDRKDAELIQGALEADGIACDIKRVDTREAFTRALAGGDYDVILGDYTMPAFDGLSAMKLALEKSPETPFIFVSGTLGEDLAIEAVKNGATDYVLKTNLRRLSPCVRRAMHELEERALRRRTQEQLAERSVENARLYQEAKVGLQRLRALHEIDTAIASTLDLSTVLRVLLEKIELFFPLAAASTVRLIDVRSGEMQPIACRNLDEKEWKAETKQTRDGLTRMLPQNNAVEAILDAQNDPRALSRKFLRKWGVASLLRVPLSFRGNIVGVLTVFTKLKHEFTAEEIEFLKTLGGRAAIAIHNSQLFDQVGNNLAQVRALREIDLAITSTLEIGSILSLLLEKLDIFLPHYAATVRLYNRETGKLDVIASRNINEDEWRTHSAEPGDRHRRSYARTVFETKQFLMVSNIAKDMPPQDTSFLLDQGLLSFVGLPLLIKDQCLGVLTLYGQTEREFTAQEIESLSSVADRAAIAIHNARLYEAIKQQAAELARANRVKDEFLSVISHELRTPLSVMIGYTGMLQDELLGPVNEKQKTVLDKMLLHGKDQLKLINDIMQATQLQVRATIVEKQVVDLAEFLGALKSDYETAAKPGVAIEWNYPDDLPHFASDAAKLKQILQNLINNAVKFTRRGKIEVSVRPAAAGRMEFKVSDTGIGIPPEELARVFEKFYQVDSSETRLFGGVGLGLHIVESLTKLMGGSVSAESEVGKGSTFTVRLPGATEAAPGNGSADGQGRLFR